MTFVEIFELFRKRLALLIAIPVACAILAGGYSLLFMPNQYTASTSMYVLTSESVIATSDLQASQMVTNDVARIVRSDRVSRETAAAVGLNSLEGYAVSVSSDNSTRVINLYVTGSDARMSAAIANAMVRDVATVAQEVMNVESVNVIDPAEEPGYPSGPNRKLYVAAALLAGLLVAMAGIIIVDMADTRVRNADDAAALLGLPVIGRFPLIKGGK